MNDLMVSVVCDVFNHEHYLRQCLDGIVMQQTDFVFEVLIHDDASTDKSVEIIQEYVEKYPHLFKPIYQKENQYSKGVRIWRDIQFSRANGKYIAICEGDDFWNDPLKLQKQVDILEAYPEYTMCYSDYINIDNVGKTMIWPNRQNNIKRSFTGDVFAELLKGNFIQTCTMLFRKEVIDDVEFLARLDYEISLQCALQGKCFFIEQSTSAYRIQQSSMIHTQLEKIKKLSNEIWHCYVSRYYYSIEYHRKSIDHMRIMSQIGYIIISKFIEANANNQNEMKKIQLLLRECKKIYAYIPIGFMMRIFDKYHKYIRCKK